MKKFVSKARFFVVFLFIFFVNQGCKPRLLPDAYSNTLEENKDIVNFIQEYKTAVEGRSIDTIMKFIAQDYREPSSALNRQGLKEELENTLPHIRNLRLSASIIHINQLDKDRYEVVLLYGKNIVKQVKTKEKSSGSQQINRMIVRQRHDKGDYKFEIIQGA